MLLAAALLAGGSLALGLASTEALAAVQASILLEGRRTEATLVVDKGSPQSLTAGQRLHLLIRGLTMESAPGVIYQIYLNLPRNATPTANDPHYVGSLNFYNATTPGAARPPTMQSFDVTELMRRDGQADREHPTIVFIAVNTPAPDSHPRIESIELRKE
jgi:hypothetical protein